MQVQNGAQATFQASQGQNVWGRPVGRLRYQGNGSASSSPQILLVPPAPIGLDAGADSVDLWINGNRWDWVNPPDTPPVSLNLHLRDGSGKTNKVFIDRVRWQEWWLVHRRLPANLLAPVTLEALEVTGGWQKQPRDIYFDSVRFYREELKPLHFLPRPQRNLNLAEGQSSGANIGPGRLPFPTREQTILPPQLTGNYHNSVVVKKPLDETSLTQSAKRSRGDVPGSKEYLFTYRGCDGELVYYFEPDKGLSGLRAELNQAPVGNLMDGAEVRLAATNTNHNLKTSRLWGNCVTAEYEDGSILGLRIWHKSLVIDVSNRSGQASELHLGQVMGAKEPRAFGIPYLTYGSSQPLVLLSRAGPAWCFSSLWLDWYRSNGSEPYGVRANDTNAIRLNGGVRYLTRTDGQRNPMFERLFLTVSSRFEEVLPTVPNPVGLHAAEATDRLWQESWGPGVFGKQLQRRSRLAAYGFTNLMQCNHEIAWRDNGESFTLRLHAAPKKGGDEALKNYVSHQRGLGWLAGLYSNYTDYAPVNEYWDPDQVQRTANGEWRSAWPRCWALRPLKAVEFDHLLAPQIKQIYNPNSAYTDVHTAVAPWGYTDFDARVPGAGTFAQTFYAYGELLRNDSRVYGGPIFSEGTYQWLYAGLADGNYALTYNGRPLAKEPLLPIFDLYQIHPKECDIGMGWTASFCNSISNWQAPANIDRAIDRFLLNTLAYGHIGWLVEETHGIARTCRSYYMLQPVQARYGLKAPQAIRYWDGTRLQEVSAAIVQDLPRIRRQLYVEYPGGLKLWCNDHPTENWQIRLGSQEVTLPPAGWAAITKDNDLVSYSGLAGTNKVDYLRGGNYTYLDGRGSWFSTPEASSNGGLVISPVKGNALKIIRISGEGNFVISRPYKVRGKVTEAAAYDLDGKSLSAPVWHDTGTSTRIEPVKSAVRYVLKFGGKS